MTSRYRIGVDLGGTKIELVALGPDGPTLARERRATPAGDYAGTLTVIAKLIADCERAHGVSASVGIGTPGALSPRTGLLRNSNSTCLNGMPLQRDLEDLLQRPVRIANDANCFALSEAVDGAAREARTVFGVIIGTGTGGGLVIDRRVHTGHNAIAGEWGHNPLPWPSDDERPGPPCYCGKRGCIETYLSGPGLALDYTLTTGKECSAEAICRLADEGDPAAEATLQRYEDRLARGLASVINLFDPDAIVLGGGLSNIRRLYDNLPRIWQDYVFSDGVTTPLLAPVHGDSSGVRGAAWLWGND